MNPIEDLPPRYRWIRHLGSGGFGVVHLVEDRELGRSLALKTLLPQAGPTDHERFWREGRMLAKIRHPNLVEIFDLGETPGGVPFLAMEWIEGESLAATLATGPLEEARVESLLDGILGGLRALHREGILHRDLKPANVLLNSEGSPKLIDFGIARTQERGSTITPTGVLLGTPGYMAPEIFRGEPETVESDLFSVGALGFELATGRPLRPPEEIGALLKREAARAGACFELPQSIRSASLRARLAQLLHPDPHLRLEAPAPSPLPTVPQAAVLTQLTPLSEAPPEEVQAGALPRRNSGSRFAIVGLLGLVFGLCFLTLSKSSKPSSPPPTAPEPSSSAPPDFKKAGTRLLRTLRKDVPNLGTFDENRESLFAALQDPRFPTRVGSVPRRFRVAFEAYLEASAVEAFDEEIMTPLLNWANQVGSLDSRALDFMASSGGAEAAFGRWQDAIREGKKGLEGLLAEPKLPDHALFWIGMLSFASMTELKETEILSRLIPAILDLESSVRQVSSLSYLRLLTMDLVRFPHPPAELLRAIETLDQAFSQLPKKDPELWRQLALLYFNVALHPFAGATREGAQAKVVAKIRRALRVSPRAPLCQEMLRLMSALRGNYLARMKRFEDAEAWKKSLDPALQEILELCAPDLEETHP